MKKKMISIYLSIAIGITAASLSGTAEAEETGTLETMNVEITSFPTPELTTVPQDTTTPTPTPVLTSVPYITLTPTPILQPSITVAPTPILTPEAPSPTPTMIPYRSKTLEYMAGYDYVGKSVTGITQVMETLSSLQQKVSSYGKLYGKGMPYEEYQEAMSNQWEDMTEYDKKIIKLSVDIKKTMDYDAYVSILKKLSRYPGVYLYKIGESTQGRDLYAVEIDVDSTVEKNVIMMTGQIHAREFAGGTFIVKELVDLVQKAQTDPKTMALLKKNKYVAVPIINVDGREAIIDSPSKWTTSGGELWKAYTNGTDGGRNFPGLQWGQVLKGSSLRPTIAKKSTYANYPGSYAGSASETKAMMKWLYHYTIVEQADILADLHQQGAIVYAGKTWQTREQAQRSLDLRTCVINLINKGITNRKYTRVYEDGLYGMRGEGSSLTDYAVSLSIGAKFSPAYGFSVFTNGKKEYILLQIKDLDITRVKLKTAVSNLAAVTVEIGSGKKYLGNSSETRRLLANEYNYYNFGKLLEELPKSIK